MSMFGDGNWNKNELYSNINMFFEQGGSVVELFEVIHTVFQYGTTPKDVLQERIDKTIELLSNGVTFCENDSQGVHDKCNIAIRREKEAIHTLRGEE